MRVLVALCLCAVVAAGLWLVMQDPDEGAFEPAFEGAPAGSTQEASRPGPRPKTPPGVEAGTAPESVRRADERGVRPEGTKSSSPESSQGRPAPAVPSLNGRAAAIQARPSGTIKLEVWDKSTGKLVSSFRYVLYGPGVVRQDRRIKGGRAEVQVPIGMPANLGVEAQGYARAELRQIHLTETEKTRFIQVKLDRRR